MSSARSLAFSEEILAAIPELCTPGPSQPTPPAMHARSAPGDKEHGLQFMATTMKTVPPTTVEGIERYLSSGLVKGIGPVLAKKLVGRSEPRF